MKIHYLYALMIDKSTIDRIYAAANIVDVIGDFVTLKKKGVNYQACCPFHNEKTPSFVVSPTKGVYKCFGCGKGGNSVSFVMEHENVSYVDALKYVAKKYGIHIEERELNEDEKRQNDNRESMLIVSSFAAEYFREQLSSTDEGEQVAMSYFRHRGFSDATIEKFALGWSPSKRDAFSLEAISKGYKEEFLTSTGLTIKREQGGYYDRFCGRVMFPIHSISGRVVAFGGRTLKTDKNVAKYLNSPESEIYHKSSMLYGLFQAKRAIVQEDCAILVEGYTDVISLAQSGIENVVASSGTSLTEEQIRLISRFTKNITIIYDGDKAGIKASLRGIDMILASGMSVRVVPLPEEDDPDSFARKNNTSALKEYIKTRQEDFISFKTRILLADTDGDPIKRAALITDIVDSIAVIPESITRSVFIKECSRTMAIDENVLINEVAKRRFKGDTQTQEFVRQQQQNIERLELQPVTKSVVPGSNIEELEKEIVKYLLRFGEENFDYKEGKNIISLNVADVIIDDLRNNEITLINPSYRAIYTSYVDVFERGEKIEINHFINHPDSDVCNKVVDILTSDDNLIISKLWARHDVKTETELDRLSEIVPKIVLLYKLKTLEGILEQFSKRLYNEDLSDDDQIRITMSIAKLNKEKTIISNRIQRIVP